MIIIVLIVIAKPNINIKKYNTDFIINIKRTNKIKNVIKDIILKIFLQKLGNYIKNI